MIKKCICILLSIQMTACATSKYIDNRQTVVNDKIIAIGKIGDSEQLKIVFSGEQYTYIADQGGEQFINMLSHTQAEQRIVQNQMPIQFLMQDDSHFSGSISIRFNQPIYQIDPIEYQKLKQLGFTEKTTFCKTAMQSEAQCEHPYGTFKLSGRIYEPIENTEAIQFKLKQPYPMSVFKIVEVEKKKKSIAEKASNAAIAVVAAPIAVAGAIIFVPFILGAVILNANNPDAWK